MFVSRQKRVWSYVSQLEQEIARKMEEHDALQMEVDVACNGDCSCSSLSHAALSSAWHIPHCLIKLLRHRREIRRADDSVSVPDDCAADCQSRTRLAQAA